MVGLLVGYKGERVDWGRVILCSKTSLEKRKVKVMEEFNNYQHRLLKSPDSIDSAGKKSLSKWVSPKSVFRQH